MKRVTFFLLIAFFIPQLSFSQGTCHFDAHVYTQDPCCIIIDAGCDDETAWRVVVDGVTTYDYTDYDPAIGGILHCYTGNGVHNVSFFVFGNLYWTDDVDISACIPPSPCEVRVEESCTPEGYIQLTAYDNDGLPIVPPGSLDGFLRWYVDGVVHHNVNPVIAYNNSTYSLEYELFDLTYPYDDHCEFKIPPTPVSIYCEGPCEDFSFIIASCNDDNDQMYDLNFPSEHCNSMCTNGYGTIGVFGHDGNPLGSGYSISWNTGATTNFISGPASNNYTVTIIDNETGCEWVGRYRLNCCTTEAPSNVNCADVYKQCGSNGPIEPNPFSRRIIWDAVSGANYYELEFSFDGLSECCDITEPIDGYTITADLNYWEIPADLECFNVRVRAYCGDGVYSDWSESFTYCVSKSECETVIVICHSCCTEGGLGNIGGHNVNEEPEAFNIYPNPNQGRINISSDRNIKNATFHLYNIYGQEVFNIRLLESNPSVSIDLPGLSNGLYLVKILQNGELIHYEQLVIQSK